MDALPARIESQDVLDEVMTAPSPALIEAARGWRGDLMILGVAGKMGPSMAVMAQQAIREVGSASRVIGVARFTDPSVREQLEAAGVETISCDLMDDAAPRTLPDAPNIIYLVGRKFGASGNPELTWAINTYLPGRVAERFASSRIAALSTGNVYPLSPAAGAGPGESDPTGPVGEYAQSCLGRERMLAYMSGRCGTRVAIIRLNYAIDLRYGVLMDLAQKVWHGQPIDLAMGYVNVIWQGDANECVLRCLSHAASPPFVLNVTGIEKLSVRQVAEGLAQRLNKTVSFRGHEADTALLSDASRCAELMGPARVSIEQMLDWTAHWVKIGGPTLAKPTHFQTRDGKF